MKKDELKVTIIQADVVWENAAQNLGNFSARINKIIEPVDLIVLPEMFTTGFTMDSERLAEGMEGATVQWMYEKASDLNCVITGGFICMDDDKIYNRHLWMRPDGTYDYYDKRHLFRMGNEHKFYSPGDRKVIVNLHGWRVRLLTCYDLRFPVWSRNRNDYDLLIYIANWPERRREPWISLLAARAVENQAITIGVNRVGVDGNELKYSGDSAIIHPRGQLLSRTMPYRESTETIVISLSDLNAFRKAFPVELDADNFELTD